MDEKTYKQCQSCGMPLEDGKRAGSEKDGSKSKMYCELCYQKGDFLQKDMTLEQWKGFIDARMKESGFRWSMRFLAKLQLPGLARWKK